MVGTLSLSEKSPCVRDFEIELKTFPVLGTLSLSEKSPCVRDFEIERKKSLWWGL